MSKKGKGQVSDKVRQIQDLRRSSAASPVNRWPNRAKDKRNEMKLQDI